MSGIRSANTKPEKLIRSLLHRRGFRFRINRRDLPGKPDLVFPVRHAVIFVHGCFWHGHDCALFKMPGTRTDFWTAKIGGNRNNDAKVTQKLLDLGWRVAMVWECALRGKHRDVNGTIDALSDWLVSGSRTLQLRGLTGSSHTAERQDEVADDTF